MMVDIVLVWIPAHQGISFHDTPDGLARETAHSIIVGNLHAPRLVLLLIMTLPKLQPILLSSHGKGSGIKIFPVFIPDG